MEEKERREFKQVFSAAISVFTLACCATSFFARNSVSNFLWWFLAIGILVSLIAAATTNFSQKLHGHGSNRAGWALEISGMILVSAAGIAFALLGTNLV